MYLLFGSEIGTFDGQEAKIERGQTGRADRIDVYYGGIAEPKGPGHGHVVSNDGVNIHYWRLPQSEGAIVKIDDINSTWEKLGQYMP